MQSIKQGRLLLWLKERNTLTTIILWWHCKRLSKITLSLLKTVQSEYLSFGALRTSTKTKSEIGILLILARLYLMTSLTCLQLRPKTVSYNFARISETKLLFPQGKLTVGLRFSTNTSERKIKKLNNQVYGTRSVWDMIQKQSLFTTNNCHSSHRNLRMNLLLLFNHPLELSLKQRESWKSRMVSLCILKYTRPQSENSGTHTQIWTPFTNSGKSSWENTLWMLLRVCRVVNSQLDFTSDG